MCLNLLTDKIKHQPPDGFSLTNVDPATIAAAAAAIDAQSASHNLLSTASSLGSPSAAAASWSVLIRDFTEYQKAAQAIAAMANSRDAAAFGSTLNALESAKSNIRDDLHAVGFGNKSSCESLFAPQGGHG